MKRGKALKRALDFYLGIPVFLERQQYPSMVRLRHIAGVRIGPL